MALVGNDQLADLFQVLPGEVLKKAVAGRVFCCKLSAPASVSFVILSFLPLVFIAQTVLVRLSEKQQILCYLIQFFSVKHIESLLLLFPAKLFLHWAINFLRDSEAFGLLLSWVSRQGVTVQHALSWSL